MGGIIFHVADTHLKHEKIWKSRGFESMEEHDHAVMNSIFNNVNARDSLIISGDVCFGGADYFIELFSEYSKKKFPKNYRWIYMDGKWQKIYYPGFNVVIVDGNHDNVAFLNKVVAYGIVSKHVAVRESDHKVKSGKLKLITSHLPIHPACLDRWSINIHGHIHGGTIMVQNSDGSKVPDIRYHCVSWEHHRKPVSQDFIVQKYLGSILNPHHELAMIR